ncbi:NAD(P)-dependent alcohol dehydrogenase [Evansella tamaricis]|uniref:NAD(P)-dependent alcohol dehydrogenase n=1 Tax=Evansella tamaricis TaxID=2069301 RepID=A0ABS6JD97_9BACI|nr:NAD(P)-dependent alcohol dehydrogenase [Evansella tamaricis]MBU9711644.1 NAD(P)-dependent alcohol dehydrogenase [Evansella tamaricis]
MKAIVCEKYGPPDVLKLEEVNKPIPKDSEVLIRVFATSVKYGDLIGRNFKDVTPGKFNMPFLFWFFAKLYFGFRTPNITILGSEFSGRIESVGKNVTSFKPGDDVFGFVGQSMGAYGEYLCISEKGILSTKPENMTYEEAAVVPYGAITALNLLRKVKVSKGQKVLIIGASGGIGSAAIQIANYFEAEVTGICSTPGVEFVKSLGADKVIDYTKEDFTKNGKTYDLIFDILGKSSFSVCKSSLTENGNYLLASFKTKQLSQMVWTSFFSKKKVICALAQEKTEDLIFVKELIELEKIKTIIDKSYPLEQTAAAHQYVESGQKKGEIVITI